MIRSRKLDLVLLEEFALIVTQNNHREPNLAELGDAFPFDLSEQHVKPFLD